MEAHKKFSSEPFDGQNEEFSNNQHKNVYNENHYSRGQGSRNFNNDYSRPFNNFNQLRGPQISKNTDNDYLRPNSQFSRTNNQSYQRNMQTNKEDDYDYFKPQNNLKNVNQRFPKETLPHSDNIDNEYINEPTTDKNNFVPHKGKYGHPLKGNYESSRSNFNNNKNDYSKNEGSQHSESIVPPLIAKQPYLEAPPIDPVKIFDYRHLPTLKVIPGNFNFVFKNFKLKIVNIHNY